MEELKEIIRAQRAQGERLRKMDDYLRGNEYGQDGVKDLIKKQSDRIEALEEHKSKEGKRLLKAGAMGGAIGGSLGVLFPKAILAKLWAFIGHIF